MCAAGKGEKTRQSAYPLQSIKNVLQTSAPGIIIGITRIREEQEVKMMTITRQTVIGDILDFDRSTAPYFLEMGMHCLGCPASRGESVEEACMVHGVNPDELVAKLNEHLSKKA